MQICPKCNAKVKDGVTCSVCGAQLSQKTSGRLHCPNCKSNNISISTESSVDGAISASRGRVSATTVSNTHRNYWFCSDCGTKFRNIQNLEEEISKYKNVPTILLVVSIIAVVIIAGFIYVASGSSIGFLMIPPIFIFSIVALVTFCLSFVYKGRLKKMRAELEYLNTNCFN